MSQYNKSPISHGLSDLHDLSKHSLSSRTGSLRDNSHTPEEAEALFNDPERFYAIFGVATCGDSQPPIAHEGHTPRAPTTQKRSI